MLKKVSRKYISSSRKLKNYFNIVSKYLTYLHKHPIYYSIDFLNIIKSLFIAIILNFPRLYLKNISRKINGLSYIFDLHFNPRFRGMFLGLNSNSIIDVFLKYIKKGTVFIDVGANVGYLSAIGAGFVGKKGQVHSFEPVPVYFEKINDFIKLNNNYQICGNNFALGEKPNTSDIYLSNQEMGSNTMISGYTTPKHIKKRIKVNVRRLDDYLLEKKIKNISLIKIDVEGYEFSVLRGLKKYFDLNRQKLPPIIVEIIPSIYPLLGINLEDLGKYMKQFSYQSFSLNEKFKIDVKKLVRRTDILYLQN